MDSNKAIMKIVNEMMGYFGLEKEDDAARQPLIAWTRMLVGIGYDLRRQESHVRKRVVQMTMDGEFIAFHESIKEAANAVGVTEPRNISDACYKRKKRNKKTSWIVRSAGGFKWKFAD